MTRAVSQRRCEENVDTVRAVMASAVGRGKGPERIRLVAKLDVRRSGPEAARYAYRWQSAWENPMDVIVSRGSGVGLPPSEIDEPTRGLPPEEVKAVPLS